MDRVFLALIVFGFNNQQMAAITVTEMSAHLSSTLSSTYLTYVRPVKNQSDAVDVQADLYLIGINSFDNAEQKLTTTAYLEITWTDEILRDSWLNTNVDALYVPQTSLWIPDIALQNGFTTLTGLGDKFLYLKVEKTGKITWRPYQVFESACDVDVTFFPFDKTSCDLQFVIWSHSADSVKIRKGLVGMNTDLYETNSEWNLLSADSSEFTTSRSTGVKFTIDIKRKPLHYLINIVVPAIMLGVLNVFVFVLPESAGENSGFAVTAFLSFAVFLTIVKSELPENSTVLSVISAFIFIMTLVSTFIVVLTILQLRIFHRPENRPVYRFWKKFFKLVSRLYCVFCRGEKEDDADDEKDDEKKKDDDEITWLAVGYRIGFVGFWGFLIFMIAFTIIVLIVSTVGGAKS